MLSWKLKKFEDLEPQELYSIFRLRIEVFVVEQKCPYQDADDKDQPSYHLMGWQNDQLVAYARLLPPGISYPEPSIGRVVSSPSVRGSGIGKKLMDESLKLCYELYGKIPIKIGAQLYLKNFYTDLGFEQVSDVYLEDDIPHIEMIRKNTF